MEMHQMPASATTVYTMRLKIAICDDEQLQTEHLKAATEQWSICAGHTTDICTFSSAEEFLFAYEDDKSFDILLLDVEMRELSGIALAKKIRVENKRSEIIFITSHLSSSAKAMRWTHCII